MKKVIFTLAFTWILSPPLLSATTPPNTVNRSKIINKAYRMQIPFIENKGQVEDINVSFYAKTFGGTVFVGKDGTLTYSFSSEGKGSVVVKEILTDKTVEVKGLESSPTRINYFKGNDQSKWKSNIPSYNSVSLGEVYQGVELTLKAYGNNVEKLFTVLPGKNPGHIKVILEGAKNIQVNDAGELEIITKHGPVIFTKPLAYQEIDGKRMEVDVSYKLTNDKCQNPNSKQISHISHHSNTPSLQPLPTTPKKQLVSYGFEVADFNKAFPLIIDPLLASTFIGGSVGDTAYSIALDGSGNVYVTGNAGTGFPTTTGAYDESINGSYDVFISKFDTTLSTLLVSTYIGGGSTEGAYFLTLDGSGNVYVTGAAYSSGYPTTPGAYDESWNGGPADVFVSKLDTNLSTLLASTYIGGGNRDEGRSLTLDGSGNVYVMGVAEDGFPIIPGAYDDSYNGGRDVFVSKLDTSLSSLLASTFLGGGDWDEGTSLTLDGGGNVYVTGYTSSTGYPTTSGAYDETYNGGRDVFVSKLDTSLSSLLVSTFLGGGWDDRGYILTLDGSGNVYVTGGAESGFPTTTGAYDTSCGTDGSCNYDGGYYTDVFVSKIDSTLSNLLASTYLGGSSFDWGNSLFLDGCNNVYVTGHAESDFPTTPGAYDESYNGSYNSDVFISKLDSTLSNLLASTYIGGAGEFVSEVGRSLALADSGNVYVTGSTYSSDYPTTPGAYDESHNGVHDVFPDVFISKLDSDLSADSGLLSASSSFLFDPFAVSLKFDVDQDGIFDIPCTELLLCEGQIVNIDVWLDNWDSVNWGEVESVSYDLSASDFTWNEQVLQVESITCDPQWDGSCTVTHTPGTAIYHLEVEKASGGFPGPETKLHTLQLKCIDIVAPIFVTFAIDNVSVTSSNPPASLEENPLNVNAICGADSFTCDADDHCERMGYNNLCPDTGVAEKENYYFWEPQGSSPICEGDTVNIFHVRKGDYPVTEAATETMCDSDCFNQCYDNCGYNEIEVCFLTCVQGCVCNHCADWDLEEVCYEYQQRINCNAECYGQCIQSYDPGAGTAQYNKRCGYNLSETITIRNYVNGDCTTGTAVETFTLEGIGAAGRGRPMPLDLGTYEICAETELIGQPVEVTDCGGYSCRILLPDNVFSVDRGISSTLENIKFESNRDGDYLLSLHRRDYNQNPVTVPSSLTLPPPSKVTVAGGGGTFDLSAIDPQPLQAENYWSNVIIRAEKETGETVECEATFDYEVVCEDIDSDGDGRIDCDDNCPNTANTDQDDTYPPQKNGIGDACDCEADFNCDGNVDGGDVGDFITHFGRSTYFNPCSNQDQCLGDFNCDINVDGGDVGIFIEDFGRSTYFNPCPPCVEGDWCVYQ